MCIILDTNAFGNFKKRDKGEIDEDMEPIWSWLYQKRGKIAYSPTEKIQGEWKKGGMINQMKTLNQAGKLKLVSADDVREKADELKLSGLLKSDDPDLIALAKIAKVKVLVVQRLTDIPRRGRKTGNSGADSDLRTDFKNLVGGAVYMTKKHSHLLRRDTCP
ncbi:MAG: hypothetical protein OXP71_09350 [Candidatus Poribacteria bacterium]|nr:hypothetical protein [Candidatus Poribacteria bacterium]